jgi:hypothetical protein
MRSCLLAALLAAPGAGCAATVHYVDVVNTAKDSLVAFAQAPAGSGAFRDLPLGGVLHGGGESATVAIEGDAGNCLRDLRAEFADGRVLIQRGFDVCRYGSYHVGAHLRAALRSQPRP